MNEIIPFGKYKGQPIEALREDKQYLDWLTTQSWFVEKYQSIYTLIVNNFTEPTETPEHNELQGKFLDLRATSNMLERFMEVSVDYIYNNKTGPDVKLLSYAEKGRHATRVKFEVFGFDVLVFYTVEVEGRHIWGDKEYPISDFEGKLWVELKPAIGDDYPAILRQIKAASDNPKIYGTKVLVYKQYTGIGVSEEVMQAIFENEGIKVLKVKE